MKFSKKKVFKLNVRSEVDQKSRALNDLIEDPGSSPSTHMSAQCSVTPVPEDSVPSSDLQSECRRICGY